MRWEKPPTYPQHHPKGSAVLRTLNIEMQSYEHFANLMRSCYDCGVYAIGDKMFDAAHDILKANCKTFEAHTKIVNCVLYIGADPESIGE